MTEPDPAILERARAIAALAREHSEGIERERRLPGALVEAIREAGLFHLWLPRHLGGLDAGLATYMAVVETVSAGDPAAGWVLMIAAETNALCTWMPEAATAAIFEDGAPVCVGTLNPAAGTARAVPGGYLVDGRWPLGSGIRNADWAISRCRLVSDAGEPQLDERGQPQTITVAVRTETVTVLDTWDVSGLLGTGSNDYTIEGVTVPEALAFKFGPPRFEGARASLPLVTHFQVGHAAHALGTAGAALEAFRAIAARPRWEERPANELALVYTAFAEAEALTRSARAWITALLDEVWARASAGDEQPPDTWPLVTRGVAHTVRTCVRAVDLLYEAGGAQSLYQANRLERLWRDMRAAGQHLHAKQRHYADSGRALLAPPPAS